MRNCIHTLRPLPPSSLRKLIRLVKEVLSIMEVLGIGCQEESILEIAEKLKLSFYDASYVFYAKEKNIPLLTLSATEVGRFSSRSRRLRGSHSARVLGSVSTAPVS